jgi:hypothetical protein
LHLSLLHRLELLELEEGLILVCIDLHHSRLSLRLCHRLGTWLNYLLLNWFLNRGWFGLRDYSLLSSHLFRLCRKLLGKCHRGSSGSGLWLIFSSHLFRLCGKLLSKCHRLSSSRLWLSLDRFLFMLDGLCASCCDFFFLSLKFWSWFLCSSGSGCNNISRTTYRHFSIRSSWTISHSSRCS